jgi:outer membrane protein
MKGYCDSSIGRSGGRTGCIMRFLAGAVFTLSLLFQGQPVMAENLIQVYRLARDQDPTFQSSLYRHEAAPEPLKQAYSELLPTLMADGDYTRRKQEILESDVAVYGFGISRYPSKQYNLTITQPLLKLSAIFRVYQAKEEVKRADLEFEAAKQDLIMRVAEAYMGALSAQDNLAFVLAEEAAVEFHFQLAQGRHSMGLAPITDYHDAKARLATVTADRIEAENELDDAFEALAEVTGQEIVSLSALKPEPIAQGSDLTRLPSEQQEAMTPGPDSARKAGTSDDSAAESSGAVKPEAVEHQGAQEAVQIVGPDPADMNQWIDVALKQNPELLVQRQEVEVAKQEVQRQRSGHWPVLEATGRRNLVDAQGSLYGGGNEIETTEFAVKASIPIFQGGFVVSRTREARKLLKAAKEDMEKQIRAVKRQTRRAYLGIESAIKKVEALRQSVISYKLALEAKQEGFNSGLFTTLAVLDAERDLYLSKQDYSQARYDYILNSLRLKQAVGILTEADPVIVNNWLEQ